MDDGRRRWSDDGTGTGLADGGAVLPAIDAMRSEVARPGWLTEDVERYPSDKVVVAARAISTDVRVTTSPGGVLIAEATVLAADRRELRAAAYRWLAELIEGQTFVKEEPRAEGARFLVATGQPEGETLAAHGHVIELHLRWQRA